MIRIAISYLHSYAVYVHEDYGVDPLIFLILFFGSAIPLYYGYYRIGKSVIKIEKGGLKKKKLDKQELRIGIIISTIAWVLPYLYVIFWGRMSFKSWVIFGVFLVVMGTLFLKTLTSKILVAKD